MKLDNKQKIMLTQKALYAKQLVAYAKLCKVYKKLAAEIKKDAMQEASSEVLAAHVQKYYGSFLAQAAQGNLDFVEDTEQAIFNDTEKQAFYAFSDASMQLEYYRDASEILFDATHKKEKDGTVSFSIDEKKLDYFKTILNPPRDLFSDEENKFFDANGRSFLTMITENPKRWIGHKFFKIATNALKSINEIDSNHIASLDTKNISLSPKSFGATITGVRGKASPSKESSSPRKEIKEELKSIYTTEEQKKYSKDYSTIEALGAATYGMTYNAKENAKEFYTANKGTIEKAAKKAVQIALVLGLTAGLARGINAGVDAYNYNRTSAYENQNLGYHQTISMDTLNTLKNNDLLIQALESSSAIPSDEELTEVKMALDDEINLVIEDLVRNSFKEQYPNLTIPKDGIVTHYDKTHIDETNSGNYIYINCHDENGKQYNYTITKFTSDGENRTNESYDNEYKLDHTIPADIYASSKGTYESRSVSVAEIIEEFKEIHQETVDLAGSKGHIDIPQAAYDNAKAADKENILLYLKAKYSKLSLFTCKPEFRTVVPEKIKPETTQSPSKTPTRTNTDYEPEF